MTTIEFIKQYLENADYDLNALDLNCQFCPLRAKCNAVSEEGDMRTCTQFLGDELERA